MSSLGELYYDVNTEFDSIETASLFLNPSHAMGAELSLSGENGPSIAPLTSLGVRFSSTLGAWTARTAIVDGTPGNPREPDRMGIHLSSDEGALLINELDYEIQTGRRAGARVALGYWRYGWTVGLRIELAAMRSW